MATKKSKKGAKPSAKKGPSVSKPVATGKPAAKGKKDPKAAKAPKVAKSKEPAIVEVPHKKKSWMVQKEYEPATGTRFRAGTSQQLAFDIVMKGAKAKKTITEIRDNLAKTRKDNGDARNLDSGYYNLVVACHPEFFQAWNTGELKVLGEPTPDLEAVERAKTDSKERKARATKARGTKVTKKPAKSKKGAKPAGRVVKKK